MLDISQSCDGGKGEGGGGGGFVGGAPWLRVFGKK